MKKITVITADITNSRKYHLLQELLSEKLSKMKQHPAIICPFSISRGDEIQGVLEGWLKAPETVRNIRYCLRPMEIKIGIGIGHIEEKSIKLTSWEMNGPPFHQARSALEDAKKLRGYFTIIKTGVPKFDIFINCILLLIDSIQNKWTEKQWEAVQIYEESGTYELAAKVLKISMQNVEKRCKAANWKQLKQAHRNA